VGGAVSLEHWMLILYRPQSARFRNGPGRFKGNLVLVVTDLDTQLLVGLGSPFLNLTRCADG
jgi:hypothetical protein